ncbi:MAG: RimK family alpha-L-glutamate ligase [Candidatus Bathyarchaeia archaeon]
MFQLKIGILTRDEESWCSTQLKKALIKRNIIPVCFNFSSLVVRVGLKPEASLDGMEILKELKTIIVRPIGRGSLEEIIFRLDFLHRLKRLGMYILNPPTAIERSVDKYYALTLLEEVGLPVPRTIVTESAEKALEAFHELSDDVVVKPIFGSRGIGSTRVSDPNVAERIFRAINFHHQVIYLQEFIPHGNSDLRIFVLGNRVLASMRRIAEGWKTNISLGAKPIPYEPTEEIEELALKAAETIGCEVSGVDILETENGPLIIELNSQPGWKGLQSITKVNIADEIINHVLNRIN